MRICRRAGVALLLLLVATATAAAATDDGCQGQPAMTFTGWDSTLGQQFGSGSRQYIFADGYICTDTDTSFQQFLAQNPPKAPNTVIVLNSSDGDFAASLRLGRLIRQQKMWTQVGSRFPFMIGGNQNIAAAAVPFLITAVAPPFPGFCYSSCTFAFLGGIYRSIDYASNYGVRQFAYTGPIAGASDQAQNDTATLLQYLTDMGVSSDFVTEMAKATGTLVNNLSMQRMSQLRITTPRWTTNWDIAPLAGGGFVLDGNTADRWGAHEIAVTCNPPTPSAKPVSDLQQIVLRMTFSLDPGTRANAQDVVGAIQNYVIEHDDQWAMVAAQDLAQKAMVPASSSKLTAAIFIRQGVLDTYWNANHVGFAVTFDPNAKLPLRLLQFESDMDGAKLKAFAATCH